MPSQSDAWAWADWDAVSTREHLQQGGVSAAEVLEAALLRAEAAAGLNALVTPTFERARAQSGRATGPFAGVPFAVKDLVQLAGVRTTWGSAASGHFVSTKTDPTAAVLEALGVATLGKTATPEFGLVPACEPLGSAPTRNPWNPAHTTGGSSGGAAALVAAGVVPFAHASDGGGSIRIPAACCGLVGLKPSRRRFDMEGSHLLPINIAVNGVLSRTVRDTVEFWKALEAALPRQHLPPIGDVKPGPERPLRIALFTDCVSGRPTDPEVKAATEQAAKWLAALGHEVEPIPSPVSQRFMDDFVLYWGFVSFIQSSTAKLTLARTFEPARFEPWTRDFGGNFLARKWAAVQAMRRLRGYGREWDSLFARHDVLLSPTLLQPAPRLGYLRTDQPFEPLLERVMGFTPFTPSLNASGAPALSLPLARTKAGLPVGVQLAARLGQEAMLLSLGLQLEAAHPWTRLAPRSAWQGAVQ
jgi:amidase